MRSAASAPGHTEEGFSLIEVMIAVALISIAFVGILSAVGGLVITGAQNKSAAKVQAVVRNVATYVQSQDTMAYTPCGATAAYDANLNTPQHLLDANVPTGFSAHVTDVQLWNGATPAQFIAESPCPATDPGLQRVTVTVSSGTAELGGAFTKTLVVLKRVNP